MAKLVTIYESYIERPRTTDIRVSTSTHAYAMHGTGHATGHGAGTRLRRAVDRLQQHTIEPGYEHWSTEELCARGRLLGIDIDSIGTRDRLITAIRRATRKGAFRRR